MASPSKKIASDQDLEVRRRTFKLCYKIIEIFLYQGHVYCLRSNYLGPLTEVDCLTRTINVCFICSFREQLDTGMLLEIKHDGVKLKQMLSDIFKVCTEAIKLGCTNFGTGTSITVFRAETKKL